MKRTLFAALLVLSGTVPVLAGGGKKAADPTIRFWEARKVLLSGDVASAAELFRIIVQEHPKAAVADDCLYWIGRCRLRQKDREPDAVVAFLRLIRQYPTSPFVDDAARELARLKDRSVIPELRARLAAKGPGAKMAAKALAEFGEVAGVDFLEKKAKDAARPDSVIKGASSEPAKKAKAVKKRGEAGPPAGKPEKAVSARGAPAGRAGTTGKEVAPSPPVAKEKKTAVSSEAEIAALRREVAELRREVEESLVLVKKLVNERDAGGQPAGRDKR